MDLKVTNLDGKDAGSVKLNEAIFGLEPRKDLIQRVVNWQLAKRQAGTHKAKGRAEIWRTGKKMYKQKGTGGARQGSTRAPHYSGGAVALGPKPRKYGQRTPKKMIKLALASALSDRVNENRVVVVDDWSFAAPSTKAASAALKSLGVSGSVLVVVGPNDINVDKSFRNLHDAQVITVGELNAYDVLCNEWVVFTKATIPTAKDGE